MRKANHLLAPLGPVFHIPAPIYTQLKQVTQSWIVSPVSLKGRWQRWRPEWPENPYHPRFVLTFVIIVFGISASLFGLTGHLSSTPADEISALPTIAPASGNPDQIEGQSEQSIRDQLGAPALIRHEPPAEIWQYRSTSCVLDLYLYPATGGRSVTHAEMRPRQNEPTAPEFSSRCLSSLRLAAHKRAGE